MSGLRYEIGDPETLHAWELGAEVEARLKDPLLDPENGFAGTGYDAFMSEKDELKEKGAYITSKVMYQLQGVGRAGDKTLAGYEEDYKTSTDNIYIDVLRHGVAVSGPMTAQYISEDAFEESKRLLGDWVARKLSTVAHLHGAGINMITEPEFTLHNTINPIDSKYIIRPGNVAAGNLTRQHKFDVDLINDAARLINMVRPKMRPAKTPWGPRFICWLSSEQVHALRESDSIWYDRMRSALQGGRISDNPMFSTVLGEEQGILFMQSDFVPPGIDGAGTGLLADTRRAWIGGAQSLITAWGRGYRQDATFSMNRLQWLNNNQDYNYRRAVAVGMIGGMKRPRFQKPGRTDYHEHVIVIETYAETPSNLANADMYDLWQQAGASIS